MVLHLPIAPLPPPPVHRGAALRSREQSLQQGGKVRIHEKPQARARSSLVWLMPKTRLTGPARVRTSEGTLSASPSTHTKGPRPVTA